MWLLALSYVCLFAFILLIVIRYGEFAPMPVHLRWELYPIPGEVGRTSYLEELNWWEKPHKKSLLRELIYMGKEIFLFAEYFHRNRSYWCFVYPFHLSIWIFSIWLFSLLAGALTLVAGMPVSNISPHIWARIVFYVILVLGAITFIFGTASCLSLIIKRVGSSDLRMVTEPKRYFDLFFCLLIFLSGLCSWAIFDHNFSDALNFMHSWITAKAFFEGKISLPINLPLIVLISALSLFMIYMPFTKMMHWLAKLFTFHMVRWDDEPNLPGSAIEKRALKQLGYPVAWSAPHVQRGKTWAEVATQLPWEAK